ncbi:MAG: hypothetical protein ABF659_07950 [Acetobacter orientalis]
MTKRASRVPCFVQGFSATLLQNNAYFLRYCFDCHDAAVIWLERKPTLCAMPAYMAKDKRSSTRLLPLKQSVLLCMARIITGEY